MVKNWYETGIRAAPFLLLENHSYDKSQIFRMQVYHFTFEHSCATFHVNLHFEKGDITDIEQLAQVPSLYRRRWATQLYEMLRLSTNQPFKYIGTLFAGKFGQRLLEEGWNEAHVYHQLENDCLHINLYSLYIYFYLTCIIYLVFNSSGG